MVLSIYGYFLTMVVAFMPFTNIMCSHTRHRGNRTYYSDLSTITQAVRDSTQQVTEVEYEDHSTEDNADLLVDNLYQNETVSGNQTLSNYTSSNCSQCDMRNTNKKMRMELIKTQILQKLHFTTLPNMTSKVLPKVPSISLLLDRFSQMQSDSPYRTEDYEEYDDDHDYYGRVDRVYTFGKPSPEELKVTNEHACHFIMPAEVHNVRIRMAILWFYVRNTIPQSTVIEIRVHKICPPSMKCGRNNTGRIYYRKHIPSNKKGKNWYRVDIRHLVHKWIRYPEYNYGLVLTAFDHDGNNLIVTPHTDELKKKGYEPMLEFETAEYKKRRPKRSVTLVCSDNTNERRCCRYPLEVDFVDFGWDWVIAPIRYSADYCSGECLSTYQDQHAHTYLRQHASPSNDGPCCTPAKLQPLSLLYFDHEQNVLYTDLQNMKVIKCGCA